MRFSLFRGNGNFLESKIQVVSQNIKCRQLLNEKDDWRCNAEIPSSTRDCRISEV